MHILTIISYLRGIRCVTKLAEYTHLRKFRPRNSYTLPVISGLAHILLGPWPGALPVSYLAYGIDYGCLVSNNFFKFEVGTGAVFSVL